MCAQRARRGHVPVCGGSRLGEGHARPEAAAAPSGFASPAPRAPQRGRPHGQLRPWHWPVPNTSGELIENKFRLYETEMDGNCLGQTHNRAPVFRVGGVMDLVLPLPHEAVRREKYYPGGDKRFPRGRHPRQVSS